MAFAAGSVWAVGRWRYSAGHVSTENASVDGDIVPILAKVGGYVNQVLIHENERVESGHTVVVIDDAELSVRLAEAEADLALARATAGSDGVPGQAQAEAAAARERRQALEARLVSARAQRDRAVRDLERGRELAATQIVSQQHLDAAQSAADAAVAEVTALEQEIAAARSAETAAQAVVRAAAARLARAEAAVEAARLDRSRTRVEAPLSGIVARTEVEVGQLIQPGQPLAAVVGDADVWVTANLKETETAEVRPGQAVEIEVDGYPGCTVRGVVDSVSPATGSKFALLAPDNATGNFTKVVQLIPVRVAVEEGCGPDRPLKPGMSVVVHIDIR
jgi:membrane fusion protein (multidrug efflux system)